MSPRVHLQRKETKRDKEKCLNASGTKAIAFIYLHMHRALHNGPLHPLSGTKRNLSDSRRCTVHPRLNNNGMPLLLHGRLHRIPSTRKTSLRVPIRSELSRRRATTILTTVIIARIFIEPAQFYTEDSQRRQKKSQEVA